MTSTQSPGRVPTAVGLGSGGDGVLPEMVSELSY